MKISPVSADLMIKLALIGVGVIAAVYLVKSLKDAATAGVAAAGDALQAVNPMNTDNVLYHTANVITGGDKSQPLGTRIYNFFHPEENL